MAYKNKSRGCNMTRQHFEKIAEIIANISVGEGQYEQELNREDIASQFADALRGTNSNFNNGYFISACLGRK